MEWRYRIIHASTEDDGECLVITEDATAPAVEFVPSDFTVDMDVFIVCAEPLARLNLDAVHHT